MVKAQQQSDGTFGTRFKDWLGAKEYSQSEGVDFFNSYTLVIKLTSICIMLSLETFFNLYLHSMDVVSAVVFGEPQKKLYVEQVEEFISKEN